MQCDRATITRDLSDTCGTLVVGVGDGDGASVVRLSLQAAARVELGLLGSQGLDGGGLGLDGGGFGLDGGGLLTHEEAQPLETGRVV